MRPSHSCSTSRVRSKPSTVGSQSMTFSAPLGGMPIEEADLRARANALAAAREKAEAEAWAHAEAEAKVRAEAETHDTAAAAHDKADARAAKIKADAEARVKADAFSALDTDPHTKPTTGAHANADARAKADADARAKADADERARHQQKRVHDEMKPRRDAALEGGTVFTIPVGKSPWVNKFLPDMEDSRAEWRPPKPTHEGRAVHMPDVLRVLRPTGISRPSSTTEPRRGGPDAVGSIEVTLRFR